MRHFLLMLSLLAAAGCGGGHIIGGPTAAVVVDGANPGTGAVLRVGQRLEVRLAGNMTTGYAWTCADATGGIVAPDGTPGYVADAAPAGAVGSGGTFVFTFVAVAPGARDLHFAYARAWEKGVPPAKTAVVSVRVE